MQTKFCAALSLLAATGVQAAQTEPLPTQQLEELIVIGQLSRNSATKSDTPLMETARSVAIVPEQLIIDRGAMNLDEALTYTAGVNGMPYGLATRGDFPLVRGLTAPVYQDSLQSLFGNYNNPRPNIYTIEQVEVLKGPAGALYGKGSPGGLINVVSKRPQEETRREIVAGYGNYNFAEIAVDFTGRLDDQGQWLYRMIGVYSDSDTQINHVEDNRRVLAPSITWRPREDTDITLLLSYNDVDADAAAQFLPLYGTLYPAPNGQYIDYDAFMGDSHFDKYDAHSYSATVLLNHQFNDIWSMEVNARYTDAQADYQQAWTAFIPNERYVFNPDDTLYKNGTVPRSWYRGDSTSEQYAVDARFRADFTTAGIDHEVMLGAQYQDVTIGDQGYYAYALGYDLFTGQPDATFGDAYWINVFNPVSYGIPPQDYLDSLYVKEPDVSSQDVGVYASDQLTLGNWILTVGLRFDETQTDNGVETQSDSAISASAGLLYQFDNGFAPYISYADTFEPVIGDNGNGDALDPQEGRQIEAGIKYEPASFPALMTLAVFDIHQTNLPDPATLPGSFEQQSGKAKVRGVEFESQASLGDFYWQVNASYLDTENPDGFSLASVPDTQASSWLSYRPSTAWFGFKAGIGVRYMGDSYGGGDTIKTPSYTLYDAMVGYEVGKWDFALNVNNASDKQFLATCLARGDCFPGERRTVVGTVRYVF